MRIPRALLAMAVAAPMALGAARVGQDTLDARLGPETARAVRTIADSARRAGLPERAIVNKALEGIAKGAAPERVLEVAREFADELAEARRALQAARGEERVTQPELAAAVSALEAGLPPAAVTEIDQAAGDRAGTVAFTIAAHLISTGMDVTRVTSMVTTALRDGTSDRQLVALARSDDNSR